MRRLQQRVIAYIMPTLTRSVVQRFGDSAYYIGKQVAQALLSMSVVDNKLHTNEVKDSIQFLALLRDNRLLTHDDFDKYKDLFHSRVDQNINTDTVLQWAQEIPVQLWTHHQDNAQKVTFGVTNQQHLANQIVFTLSGVSLISYAFLYVLVSDLRVDKTEVQLLHKILAYFEKPESLFRLISSETTISAMTKNILGSEIRVYVEKFIDANILPYGLMQRVIHSQDLLHTENSHVDWKIIVEEITEIDTSAIDNNSVSMEPSNLMKPPQLPLPIEIPDTKYQKSFLKEGDLTIASISSLTNIIEDVEERVLVASTLHEITLNAYGKITEIPVNENTSIDKETNHESSDDELNVEWYYLVEQLIKLPIVTQAAIEEIVSSNVPQEQIMRVYPYVVRQLHYARKPITEDATFFKPSDQVFDVDPSKIIGQLDIIENLLNDINQRLEKSFFIQLSLSHEKLTIYHALLSKGEEYDLCAARHKIKLIDTTQLSAGTILRIRDVDSRIREILINHNYRLVMHIACQFELNARHLELMDLFQEGCIGLIIGIERFDVSMNLRLSTYVTWWIRQAIGRAIDNNDRIIRLPVHFLASVQKYKRTYEYLLSFLERNPSDEEMAHELKLKVNDVLQLNYWSHRISSLNEYLAQDEESEIGDHIIAPTNLVQDVEHRLLVEEIRDVLQKLSERERRIIIMRFGLNGEREHTLQEIGVEIGVSRERIRQIEADALRQLRRNRERFNDYMV